MEGENIAIRLKGFIDSLGITNSQFADNCGIPRPSLSQIISGRNKKVSDLIVGQIHKRYPELSVLWLLFGEGEMNMPVNAGNQDTPLSGNSPDSHDGGFKTDYEVLDPLYSQGLFMSGHDGSRSEHPSQSSYSSASDSKIGGNANENPENGIENPGYANLKAFAALQKACENSEKERVALQIKIDELQKQIDEMTANPRKVTQITLYYDDSTFETFVPKG